MMPALCGKCRRPMTTPSIESTEQAARDIIGADPENSAGVLAIGAAGGLLAMFAGCLRGLCLSCQPEDVMSLYSRATAGRRTA